MTLNCSNGWKPEPQLILASKISFFACVAYFSIFSIFNAVFELNMSNIFNFCMQSSQPVNLTLLGIFIMIPILVTITTTSIMDIKCLLFIKNHGANRDRFELSLRASIISTLITIPYFILASILSNLMGQLSIESKTFLSLFTQYLVIIIRNPLISTCAFRVNASIQRQLDAQQDREHRRNVEMEHALKARVQRSKGG